MLLAAVVAEVAAVVELALTVELVLEVVPYNNLLTSSFNWSHLLWTLVEGV